MAAGENDGAVLADIIYGETATTPRFARTGAPEPSLLPHLGRLVHDFSVKDLATAAHLLGTDRGPVPPWYQVRETTLGVLTDRFLDDPSFDWFGLAFAPYSRLHLEIIQANWRATRLGLPVAPDLIVRADADGLDHSCRLAAHGSPDRVRSLVDQVTAVGPGTIEAEPARALLEAMTLFDVSADPWLLETWLSGPPSLRAHLLPHLPRDQQPAVARDLATWITEASELAWCEAWYVSLVVSRVSPHLAQQTNDAWVGLTSFGEPWQSHIEALRTGELVSMSDDVLRAHPYSDELNAIEQPHESTERAPRQLLDQLIMHESAAGQPGESFTPPSGPTRSIDFGVSPPDEPRTLQADVVVDGRKRQETFVAAVLNSVRFSVGRLATHTASSPFNEPDFDGRDEVELPVWMRCAEQITLGTIRLPSDVSLESSTVEIDITPPAETDFLQVHIVVYSPDGTDVLQAGELSGEVSASAASDSAAQDALAFTVVRVRSVQDAPPNAPKASLVHTADELITNAASTDTVTLGAASENVRSLVRNFIMRVEEDAGMIHHGFGQIEATLRVAADFGATLKTQLPNVRELDGHQRIQVISLDNSVVLPLELLYDGPPPTAEATLCSTWEDALATGACATCGDSGPSDGSTICVLQFWALSKVIEHHGPSLATSGATFTAQARTVAVSALAPLQSVLVAASERVTQVDPAGRDTVANAANDSIGPGTATIVDDWSAWQAAVKTATRSMFVAMPHQESVTGGIGTQANLELGGQLAHTFDPSYLVCADHVPNPATGGPIVVLLGCNTAVDPSNSMASMATVFRGSGASVVISSLGEVIAEQAPVAAAVLISEMSDAMRVSGVTVGDAVLQTRRNLIKTSTLLGLMLVAHGDSDWESG